MADRLTPRKRRAAETSKCAHLSLIFEFGALLVPGGADLRELAVSFRRIQVWCRATGEELGRFDLKGKQPRGFLAFCGLSPPEEHGTWSLGPRTALELKLRRAAPHGVVLAIEHAVAAGRAAGIPVQVSSGWNWTAHHVFHGGEQRVELGPPDTQPARDAGPHPASAGQQAMLVLGVHRSGTSAMAAALARAGAAPPCDLMPAMPDNPSGFWESVGIAAFNDDLLQRAGSRWDDVFAGLSLQAQPPADAALVELARDMICDRFSGRPVIMLKDPRITLLMPFWKRALRAARYAPCCIIMVREPRQVADSLLRRNGFPRAKGLLLWAGHMLAAERGTRGMPRVFVGFDDFLRSAETQLRMIGGALDLPWLRNVLPVPELARMTRRPARGRPPAWDLGPFSRLTPFYELLAGGPAGLARLEGEADGLHRWFRDLEGASGAIIRENNVQRLPF